MSTTRARAATVVVALVLTGVALTGCRDHAASSGAPTTTVTSSASATTPTTGPSTATTVAATDPHALAELQRDLDAATADLDAADQQLRAADTESTTDTRG